MGIFPALNTTALAQDIFPVTDKGGLHGAYIVPIEDFDRVDVQLIVLSGAYDDPNPSGTAHLTEHLAAFSADSTVLRKARERDINAKTFNAATVYTNAGQPADLEKLLRLSRAVLDTPKLPDGFAQSEIDIVERETFLRERQYPSRWLTRLVLQDLYETPRGRANNTVDDLPNLNLATAYQFHKDHYVPSNVTVIVSGKIDRDEAAELVTQVFGDTARSTPPAKPWLDQKPLLTLRSIKHINTNRLPRDTVQFAKFIDFEDHPSSFELQGAFFIAVDILNTRLENALHFNDVRFLGVDMDWYFATNADLEMTLSVELMPGFALGEAHRNLRTTMKLLLREPIGAEEIKRSRQKAIVNAQHASRTPSGIHGFLKNLAADGFPPFSPSRFIDLINATTDQEVIDFADKVMQPSATATILAKKVD
ncbi:insulinase family protein [uncultured Shimia sp.]|uniref:M16 family metallopeptidase n=1 Tax=uncultured Shimia sp. TaxID=573152 RepID=UPI0025F4919A|nr:insulinase family protein [uncultured Shimia sp.]